MDFLVTFKNPVSALGRQVLGLIRDLGRIFLLLSLCSTTVLRETGAGWGAPDLSRLGAIRLFDFSVLAGEGVAGRE